MDDALMHLAGRAGISPHWHDAFGRPQTVPPDALRAILAALGLPAASPSDLADSIERAAGEHAGALPPLVTADAGAPVLLPVSGATGRLRYRIALEGGGVIDGEAEVESGHLHLPALDVPGYHTIEMAGQGTVLAVAPARCFSIADAAGSDAGRLWALAVQIYALRRSGDCGIGDFSALSQLAVKAANAGAAGLVMSPVHAGFPADPHHFSPYAPSSRQFLNPLHADPHVVFGGPPVDAAIAALGCGAEVASLERAHMVDWPAAAPLKYAILRRLYQDALPRMAGLADDFAAFRTRNGPALEDHARFEAIHAAQFSADPTQWNWRTWGGGLSDPRSDAVAGFARQNPEAVGFHAFLQWVADRSLGQAQDAARAAGMPIGLISDLAVGTDGGGSQAWSRQADMLIGLSVGAPPDLLNALGQSWGLAAFSPRALAQTGFAAFRDMLRAVMGHAGGVRIDHIMGLMRLWLVPEGFPPTQGAYLAYPFEDLARLVALESHRHRAILIGEDLGTVPEGFRARLAARGILGMRVLWFERHEDRFARAADYDRDAIAVTGTHDLPTVAGWWKGRDIDWRVPLGIVGEGQTERTEREARGRDRRAIWQAIAPDDADPDAPPEDPERVVDAALSFIGRTPAPLVVIPIEDALALEEQPNLPGTIDEHPNWRRRLGPQAADLLEDPSVQQRLARLDAVRKQP
ncbi:4-alpha-glucanotransferase [Aquabacter spiritensis]|uniref:4-alpha-glucanotransferase n=1 Tax=Aquabacter spiritensis TaxID=933073 RepID=A0A4R3LXY3_9HYPH|nr:4-alpha-glucanotransferase [Aquabacter spiritensis]TCT05534.1 4-alpha-glucanotransferase [Aquabacter spiritensis]